MTQGERVKTVRKSLHLTLEKFGEKLGVTKVAISNIEKGNRALTDQMTRAICREYNVNYDWLLSEEGDMFDALPQTILDELCRQYDLNEFDRVLISMYLNLSSDERRRFMEKVYEAGACVMQASKIRAMNKGITRIPLSHCCACMYMYFTNS